MSEKVPNGNKVSDVHVENGFVTSEKKPIANGNKVIDSHMSTPSVSSMDSCTKLTLKDSEDSTCCGSSTGLLVAKLTICAVCGIFFGIALEKGRGKISRRINGFFTYDTHETCLIIL